MRMLSARRVLMPGSLVLVAVLLAACGSSSSGGSSTTSSGGAGTSASSTSSSTKTSGTPVKVMVIAQSGTDQFNTPELWSAADAYAKQLNAAGGINGRPV